MTPLQLKSYNLALYIYISVYILDCDYKNSWGKKTHQKYKSAYIWRVRLPESDKRGLCFLLNTSVVPTLMLFQEPCIWTIKKHDKIMINYKKVMSTHRPPFVSPLINPLMIPQCHQDKNLGNNQEKMNNSIETKEIDELTEFFFKKRIMQIYLQSLPC